MVKTIKDILKFKPEFRFGNMTMVEWYEVHLFYGDLYGLQYTIRSGLKHADGKTKSPYFYDKTTYGKNSKKEAIKEFNKFLESEKTFC